MLSLDASFQGSTPCGADSRTGIQKDGLPGSGPKANWLHASWVTPSRSLKGLAPFASVLVAQR